MTCASKTFRITRGDTLPVLRMLLHEELTGEEIEGLSGATAVLYLKDRNRATVFSATGTVYATPLTDPITGLPYNFEYAWQSGDTDLPVAKYRAQVRVTFSGGGTLTIPSDPSKADFVEIEREV